jgi:hypothetical protein
MPIVFYKGQPELKKFFGNYMMNGGQEIPAWNDKLAITDPPPGGNNAKIITEAGIIDTVTSMASKGARIEGVPNGQQFFDAIRAAAAGGGLYTVYVLKGVHTKPELHMSVGVAGTIYHLNVKRMGSDDARFSINSMSAGGQTWDDPDWTVNKKT